MSNDVIEISEANFSAQVEQAIMPVFVDIWAPWCGPCKSLAPLFDKLAEIYCGRIRFVKINADENKDLVKRLGVSGLPTLLLFKQGKVVERTSGAQSKSHFTNLLDRHVDQPITATQNSIPAKAYRAFYGDASLRDAVVERVRQHVLADEIVTGLAPVCDEVEGKYSLMGAALNAADAERYEGTFSIPAHVARLEEVVHCFVMREVIDADGNKKYAFREPTLTYPLDWLNSIPLGANLQRVTPEFIRWFLSDLADAPQPYGLVVNDAAKAAAREVALLHERTARGEMPTSDEWKQARTNVGEVQAHQSSLVRGASDAGKSLPENDMFSLTVIRDAEMLAWPVSELESAEQGALGLTFYMLMQAGIRHAYTDEAWAERVALQHAAQQREVSMPDATPEQLGSVEEIKAYRAYLAKVQEADNAQICETKYAYGEHLHRGLMNSLSTVMAAQVTR